MIWLKNLRKVRYRTFQLSLFSPYAFPDEQSYFPVGRENCVTIGTRLKMFPRLSSSAFIWRHERDSRTNARADPLEGRRLNDSLHLLRQCSLYRAHFFNTYRPCLISGNSSVFGEFKVSNRTHSISLMWKIITLIEYLEIDELSGNLSKSSPLVQGQTWVKCDFEHLLMRSCGS